MLSTIGRYKITGELGRGSSSVVYRAIDPFEDREVAVKLFNPPTYLSEAERKKSEKLFLVEASMVGKLNHPHIVNIYDAQVTDEQAYIVMELVAGEPLENFTSADALLPIEKVMGIMYKCCNALAFAYKQGVIHRDIKPANIILTANGEIKIADFGAALLFNLDATQVSNVGSPAYMSPEQIKAMPLSLQTDIYSLGVVMFKLLTGKLPHEADNPFALMHKIVNDDAISIRSVRPDIPEKIATLVHLAIEKDITLRYLDWSSLAEDIATSELVVNSAKQITDSEKLNSLKDLDFFEDFSELDLLEVLKISQWARFPAGKTLVKEGEFGSSFYLLVKGQVNVLKGGKKLAHISKGSCFGEMAYIDKAKAIRTASIFSISPVTIIKFSAIALEKASWSLQVRFNRAFLSILVQRLSSSNHDLVGDFILKE